MKPIILAAAIAAALAGAPLTAMAEDAPPAAPVAAAKISVETTPIGEIIKNDKAKAILEAALPEIPKYYDQIATMTLTQVAPMSQGALDDAKLKALQAAFDAL